MMGFAAYLEGKGHAAFKRRFTEGALWPKIWAVLGASADATRQLAIQNLRQALAHYGEGALLDALARERLHWRTAGEGDAALRVRLKTMFARFEQWGTPAGIIAELADLGFTATVTQKYLSYGPGAPRPEWATLVVKITATAGTYGSQVFWGVIRNVKAARDTVELDGTSAVAWGTWDDGGNLDDGGELDDWS